MELHPALLAVPADDVDAGRAVPLDALVYRYRMDLDAVPGPEHGRYHPERDHAVLPAGDGDRYPVAAVDAYLLADLPLHPLVHVAHEVLGAEVGPVVADERDRLAAAEVAPHRSSLPEELSRRDSIFSESTFEGMPGREIRVVLPLESLRTMVCITPSFSMSWT